MTNDEVTSGIPFIIRAPSLIWHSIFGIGHSAACQD